MSISDSIFAGNGRPLIVSSHLRVPVKGPFNTLVIVHIGGASLYSGITINTGKMVRSKLSFPSDFVLAGFDQRQLPAFVHSTTGFLSYIASSDDATFTYAIDAVSAHFDEVGRYCVDYDAATLNIKEVTSASVSLTSWVLVNEPPVQSTSKQHRTTSKAVRADVTFFGLPLQLITSTNEACSWKQMKEMRTDGSGAKANAIT